MKKKILAISLIVALAAIAVVGGSLAWFTDEDSATNTFVFGEIDIFQHEHEHDDAGNIQDFTQDQTLLPLVNLDANGDVDLDDPTIDANDGNYVEKLVSVENLGKNDAYVRTFIAVPASIKDIVVLDVAADDTAAWTKDNKNYGNVTVGGIEYAIVSFTYNTAMAKGDVTPYVLKGVYLKPEVDAQVDPADNVKKFCTVDATTGAYTFYDYDITAPVNVLVVTQGCQTAGFTGTAAQTLDTVFPNVPAFN